MGLFRLKIGRGWYSLLMIACFAGASALNTVLASHKDLQHILGVPLLFRGAAFLLVAVYATVVTPARLRDLGLTPWLALLLLIPVLDIVLAVFLLFATKKTIENWKSSKRRKAEG